MNTSNTAYTKSETELLELQNWARQLPKISLHRHLEGSLRIQTLAELAWKCNISLPAYEIEALRPYVQITNDPPDFHNYINKFTLLRHFYVSKDVIERVVRETIADAAADNVLYFELRFNPVALSRAGNFSLADVVDWVETTVQQAQQDYQCRTCLILQIGREEPIRIADEIVDIAIAHLGDMVRGIDLAGDEVHYPPQLCKVPFRRAKQAGLRITAHGGEAMGADSVRAALQYLDAERIGHGIRSIEDAAVVTMLKSRGTTLEVCPTSNFQTGAAPHPPEHPLGDLYAQGVRVTLNTDNPSISATTLSNEYVVAVRDIGLKRTMIFDALHNAVDAAFIPDDERDWLKTTFEEALKPFEEALLS